MSLSAPESVVLGAIHDAGLGLTRGANLFAGPLRPGKALACFCISTGGPTPQLMARGQAEIQTVQVTLWSAPDQYQAGVTLARSVLRTLQRSELGGYYHVEVRESDPSPIGLDDNQRHGFALNVELHGIRR